MLDSCKLVEKQSEAFHTFLLHFFPSLKQNFIAYRSSKVSDCFFEIHQQWQSSFSRVYSNSCCSCSFEAEIISISQSSHKMYSNNILNSQDSTTVLNAHTKSLVTYCMHLVYISCHAATTGLPDPLLPHFSIVHLSRVVYNLYLVSAQSCCI